MTVMLHVGNDKKFKQLFYATAHSPMMSKWGQKLVWVDLL